MGLIKSLLENKVDEQEAKRFQSLQGDLRGVVLNVKTVLNECGETLKSIRSEEKEESETITTLQEKIQAFEEEIGNPLIEILTSEGSLQDQISATLKRQAEVKNLVDRGVMADPYARGQAGEGLQQLPIDSRDFFRKQVSDATSNRQPAQFSADLPDPTLNFWSERLAWEKEREKDLQAVAVLFEGEYGIRKLVSRIERTRETMDQVKDLKEDLDYRLARLREEPCDELEELDALGERMNQLAKWL